MTSIPFDLTGALLQQPSVENLPKSIPLTLPRSARPAVLAQEEGLAHIGRFPSHCKCGFSQLLQNRCLWLALVGWPGSAYCLLFPSLSVNAALRFAFWQRLCAKSFSDGKVASHWGEFRLELRSCYLIPYQVSDNWEERKCIWDKNRNCCHCWAKVPQKCCIYCTYGFYKAENCVICWRIIYKICKFGFSFLASHPSPAPHPFTSVPQSALSCLPHHPHLSLPEFSRYHSVPTGSAKQGLSPVSWGLRLQISVPLWLTESYSCKTKVSNYPLIACNGIHYCSLKRWMIVVAQIHTFEFICFPFVMTIIISIWGYNTLNLQHVGQTPQNS